MNTNFFSVRIRSINNGQTEWLTYYCNYKRRIVSVQVEVNNTYCFSYTVNIAEGPSASFLRPN